MSKTVTLPWAYRVGDGDQSYHDVIVDSDAETLTTPDGTSLLGTELRFRVPDTLDSAAETVADDWVVKAPTSDDCLGRTATDTYCGLAPNWGRSKPFVPNPGRCRYHDDQPLPEETDTDLTPTPTAPCQIDAAAFVAAKDSDTTRHDDSGVRPDSPVDIEAPDHGGTGQGSIGFVRDGEWTEYLFQAPTGTYVISLAVASKKNGELAVSVDGEIVGTVVRNTGDWYNFQMIQAGRVTFSSDGTHTLRVAGGATPLNYDAIQIDAVEASTGSSSDGVRYGEGPYGGGTG